MAYGITVSYLYDEPLSDEAEKAYVKKASKTLYDSLLKQAGKLTSAHAAGLLELADRAKRLRSMAGLHRFFRDLEEFADTSRIDLKYRSFRVPEGPREWSPRVKGLEEIPLPPDIPRPEMWDLEAVVRAVQDGYTFLLPFKIGESLFTPNAYWIAGQQASAFGLTMGPEHTPKVMVLPDGWLQAETFFMPEMVPERAWLAPPNKYGVVPVHAEIDPDTVDWDLLNRGHQIRTRRIL